MATANSTNAPKVWKHKGSGLWCLTRKGRRYYLGSTESEAKQRYQRYKRSIDRGLPIPKLGEDPPEGNDAAPTIKNICLVFLESQKLRVDQGDLSQRSLNDYAKSCRDFSELFGELWVSEIKPEHFAEYKADVASRRNLVSVGNEVTRIKTIFKTLFEDGVIDAIPNFGKHFKRPKKADVRAYKHSKGRKDLSRDECLLLLAELGVHERAMALLGLNAGFGNSDLAILPIDDVDLDEGKIVTIRSKTKEYRVATLWPETVEALELSLGHRHKPNQPEAEDSFFVTFTGKLYVQKTVGNGKTTNDLLNVRTRAAMQRVKIHQQGRNFYNLRHTFRTVANAVGDDKATAWIMGHVRDEMSDTYVHEAPMKRIQKVTDHVRNWLFGGEE